MNKMIMKKIIPCATIVILIASAIGVTIAGNNFVGRNSGNNYHADITLSNEQIKIWYTDEAAGIGNYTNDTVEPRGWELFPSIYWDSNENSIFEDEETMISTIFPVIHYIESGNAYSFAPLHQSIMQQPSDATIVSAGWISAPNMYASEVQDNQNLVTVNSTISIYNGNNYVRQTLTVKNIGITELTNVDLIVYLGIDINGFFDDYAFIDTDTNNMVKAKDNNTGVWFGAYPTDQADNYEIGIWDDGPFERLGGTGEIDIYSHCLNNNLNGQNHACNDVEGALQFDLSTIPQGETESITLYYSFAHNENDLYPPEANHPPYAPYDPTPDQGATNISILTNISWLNGDPDPGDTVTYDIYFGDTTPPPQVESNWPDMEYTPGTLEYDKTYYWYIVARDDHGASNTSEWNFTTETSEEVTCGDCNNDGIVDLGDIVYLVNYLFRQPWPEPQPMACVGDVNNDDVVDLGDVVYLLNYLFRQPWPEPNPDCCNPP